MTTSKKKSSKPRSTSKDNKKNTKKKSKDNDVIKIHQSGDIDNIRDIINNKFKSEVAPVVEDKPLVIQPTGILSMDLAVNNGGLLGGRIVDTHGWEATGKTLLTMTIGGYVQRCEKIDYIGKIVKKLVAFLDAEGTFSAGFSKSTGLNPDELILIRSTPDCILSGEDYFDTIVLLLGQGVDYIIVDSCPALVPRIVLTNETGQGQKATDAQLMSMGLKKVTPLVNSSGQSIVHFINQMRGKPMAKKWESSETATGGNALKFYSSYRMEVTRSEDIHKNVLGADGVFRNKKVGVNSCIKLIKSKVAPIPPPLPGQIYHFDFDIYFEDFKDDEGFEYNRGVDVVKDYVDTATRCGIITQSSSWYNYGDIKANGKNQMIHNIRENPEIMAQIRDDVFSKMKVATTSQPIQAVG